MALETHTKHRRPHSVSIDSVADASFSAQQAESAATRLAEAGCTPHQIMAVLGHTTHQQAALYTRAADRAGMADQALGRLYGEQMDPPVDLGGFQFGEKILMDQTPKRSLAVPRGRR